MNTNQKSPASVIALGGVLAALAVVIMAMGTLIPVATYVCPMLCIILLQVVLKVCGSRIAWAWYGAVSVLSILLAPDKEAVTVFLFLGYYPIVRPGLDDCKGKWIWKLLLFNTSILLAYWFMIRLFGFNQVAEEFAEMGTALGILLLILGNLTFFLLDRLLEKNLGNRVRKGGPQ